MVMTSSATSRGYEVESRMGGIANPHRDGSTSAWYAIPWYQSCSHTYDVDFFFFSGVKSLRRWGLHVPGVDIGWIT